MRRYTCISVLLLIVAAALRFYGLDWDGGIAAHPDERYVLGVAEGLRWPDRLNPFDVSGEFAYGHLPVYLLASIAGLLRGVDPLPIGRMIATVFDLGTVVMTLTLGRRLYGARAGLLAAAFVALMLLHVQQAHFYTADTLLAFFVLGALFFAARLSEGGRALDGWLAGAWAGLALGTKLSAGLLLLPLALACAVAPVCGRSRWALGLRCAGGALLAFALTNPFAVLDWPAFWRNAAREAAIARGLLDAPYTRQFHGTRPYLYPILQQLRWGMGWPLGLTAMGGLAYAVWRAVREPPRRAEWVLLAWALPYFAFVGALYAKFPRYLLPLTPVLVLYGARLLLQARPKLRDPWRGKLTLLITSSCLLYSLLHCLAFVSIYRAPHPWLVASEWFEAHAPEGAVVAVEQWDHPLPLAGDYDVRELPVFDEDTPEKWAAVERILMQADYVVIASQRGYGALARWPERYPLMARYYEQLFAGGSSSEPVACFVRFPRLGPLVLADDPTMGLDFSLPDLCRPQSAPVLWLGHLDESFVVYDHPQAIIFAKRLPRASGLPRGLRCHSATVQNLGVFDMSY